MERIQVGKPYKDYYYYEPSTNKVYNIKTNNYIRNNKNNFKLLLADNSKYVNVSLKAIHYITTNKVYCKDTIADLEGEVWQEIKESKGNYFISNMGRLKSYKWYTSKILVAPILNGYERINININDTNYNILIHRLVAEYFLPMPQSTLMQVHHKDFNKLNNKADNLVWLSKEEHRAIHTRHEQELKENNLKCGKQV